MVAAVVEAMDQDQEVLAVPNHQMVKMAAQNLLPAVTMVEVALRIKMAVPAVTLPQTTTMMTKEQALIYGFSRFSSLSCVALSATSLPCQMIQAAAWLLTSKSTTTRHLRLYLLWTKLKKHS